MKKFFLCPLILILLATMSFANEQNSSNPLTTREEYELEYEALTEKEYVRHNVTSVFIISGSLYSEMEVVWAVDEWAARNDVFIASWSRSLYNTLTRDTQLIRKLLEEIYEDIFEEGELSSTEMAVLGLAREMFEASTTQPELDVLGASILAYSRNAHEDWRQDLAHEAYALYLEFKEEIANPLPWPQDILVNQDIVAKDQDKSPLPETATEESNSKQNNATLKSLWVSPLTPLQEAMALLFSTLGLLSYHQKKYKKYLNDRHISEKRYDVAGVTHGLGENLPIVQNKIGLGVVNHAV